MTVQELDDWYQGQMKYLKDRIKTKKIRLRRQKKMVENKTSVKLDDMK
jgi:hypothetical protein